VTAGALWLPWAAELTVANRGDHEEAPLLLEQWPEEVRSVLGDPHDTPPSGGRTASRGAGSWALRAGGRIPTAMAAPQYAKGSINCARQPWSRSRGC
jgi:hypothetical protein